MRDTRKGGTVVIDAPYWEGLFVEECKLVVVDEMIVSCILGRYSEREGKGDGRKGKGKGDTHC